ncbi:hypothetical protein GQ44DRAFT_729468 [Phaeosphaeriaceae sp. PMI808]|nr:hypothetical protein GQ44DRAFT_729468 [Phaeosphaeriaceae sp. PMI808]
MPPKRPFNTLPTIKEERSLTNQYLSRLPRTAVQGIIRDALQHAALGVAGSISSARRNAIETLQDIKQHVPKDTSLTQEDLKAELTHSRDRLDELAKGLGGEKYNRKGFESLQAVIMDTIKEVDNNKVFQASFDHIRELAEEAIEGFFEDQ